MAKRDDRPDYRKVLQGVSNATGTSLMDVFRSWVKLCACAMSCGAREAEYMEEIRRWDPAHAEAFAEALGHLRLQMEARPYEDLLGDTFQENLSASRATQMGQFFTPTELCRLMARMSIEPARFREGRVVEVYEPTSGSGRCVLAFWEAMAASGLPATCARATCWDVDPLSADMTVVNLSLSGIPAMVVQGNTLSQKVEKTTYTPLWPFARSIGLEGAPEEILGIFHALRTIVEEAVETLPDEMTAPEPVAVALEEKGQYAMDFQEAA